MSYTAEMTTKPVSEHRRRGVSRALLVLSGVLLTIALAACTPGAKTSSEHTVSLPKDYPSSSVPIAPDSSLTTAAKSGKAYTFTVSVKDAAGQKAALAALQKKGFVTVGKSGSTAADQVYSLANSSYSVRLGFGKTAKGYTVSYGVSERAGK